MTSDQLTFVDLYLSEPLHAKTFCDQRSSYTTRHSGSDSLRQSVWFPLLWSYYVRDMVLSRAGQGDS